MITSTLFNKTGKEGHLLLISPLGHPHLQSGPLLRPHQGHHHICHKNRSRLRYVSTYLH